LKTFGFTVSNDTFAENSWYFRNALVRANYNNLKLKITSATEYLEPFFENLLLDTHHELKNRFLHVGFQSADKPAPKCNICTLEELAILRALDGDPSITQKQLAEKIGKSERTVKTRTVEMQEKGLIRRLNGKRNGTWEILIEINE
jgi:DNA-binding MarR family transcriptional regulator